MEFITISILNILYLITSSPMLLYAGAAILLHGLNNLNPLLRYDGYWTLSDMINVPNLRKQANNRLKEIAGMWSGKTKRLVFTKLDWFLAFYAVGGFIMITAFVTGVLWYDSESVIYFPYNLYALIGSVYNDSFNWQGFNTVGILLPAVFYFLIIRILIRIIKKYLLNGSSGTSIVS